MLISQKLLCIRVLILLAGPITLCINAKSLPHSRRYSKKNIKITETQTSIPNEPELNTLPKPITLPSRNEPELYTLPKPITQLNATTRPSSTTVDYMNDIEYDLRLRQLMEELVLKSPTDNQEQTVQILLPPNLKDEYEHQVQSTISTNKLPQVSVVNKSSISNSSSNFVPERNQSSTNKDSHLDFVLLEYMTNAKQNLSQIIENIKTNATANNNLLSSIDTQKIRQQLEFLQKNAGKFKKFQHIEERTKNTTTQAQWENILREIDKIQQISLKSAPGNLDAIDTSTYSTQNIANNTEKSVSKNENLNNTKSIETIKSTNAETIVKTWELGTADENVHDNYNSSHEFHKSTAIPTTVELNQKTSLLAESSDEFVTITNNLDTTTSLNDIETSTESPVINVSLKNIPTDHLQLSKNQMNEPIQEVLAIITNTSEASNVNRIMLPLSILLNHRLKIGDVDATTEIVAETSSIVKTLHEDTTDSYTLNGDDYSNDETYQDTTSSVHSKYIDSGFNDSFSYNSNMDLYETTTLQIKSIVNEKEEEMKMTEMITPSQIQHLIQNELQSIDEKNIAKEITTKSKTTTYNPIEFSQDNMSNLLLSTTLIRPPTSVNTSTEVLEKRTGTEPHDAKNTSVVKTSGEEIVPLSADIRTELSIPFLKNSTEYSKDSDGAFQDPDPIQSVTTVSSTIELKLTETKLMPESTNVSLTSTSEPDEALNKPESKNNTITLMTKVSTYLNYSVEENTTFDRNKEAISNPDNIDTVTEVPNSDYTDTVTEGPSNSDKTEYLWKTEKFLTTELTTTKNVDVLSSYSEVAKHQLIQTTDLPSAIANPNPNESSFPQSADLPINIGVLSFQKMQQSIDDENFFDGIFDQQQTDATNELYTTEISSPKSNKESITKTTDMPTTIYEELRFQTTVQPFNDLSLRRKVESNQLDSTTDLPVHRNTDMPTTTEIFYTTELATSYTSDIPNMLETESNESLVEMNTETIELYSNDTETPVYESKLFLEDSTTASITEIPESTNKLNFNTSDNSLLPDLFIEEALSSKNTSNLSSTLNSTENGQTESVIEIVWLTQSSSYQKPSVIIENVPYKKIIPDPLSFKSNNKPTVIKEDSVKPEEGFDNLAELLNIIGNSLQDSDYANKQQKQKMNNTNEGEPHKGHHKQHRLVKLQEDVTWTVNCHTQTMQLSVPSPTAFQYSSETAEQSNNNIPMDKTIENHKQSKEKWSTLKNNQLKNDSLTKADNDNKMEKNVHVNVNANGAADADDVTDVNVNDSDWEDDDDDNDKGTTTATLTDDKDMRLDIKVDMVMDNENVDDNNNPNAEVDIRPAAEAEAAAAASTVAGQKYWTNNEFKVSQIEGGINEMSTIDNKLLDISKHTSNGITNTTKTIASTSTSKSTYDKHEVVNKNRKKVPTNNGNDDEKTNKHYYNSTTYEIAQNQDDVYEEIDNDDDEDETIDEIKDISTISDIILNAQPFPDSPPNHHSNSNGDKHIPASAQTKQEITTTNWWHSVPYAEIRKFLNSILESVTSSTDFSLNRSVDTMFKTATTTTASTSKKRKVNPMKERKSNEQWSSLIFNYIWSIL